MLQLPDPPVGADSLPPSVVLDSLASVIATGEYARGLRDTLFLRFISWIEGIVQRAIDAAGDFRAVRWTAIGLLVVIVASVVGRTIWYWVLERRALERLERAAGARLVDGEDPLLAARRAAGAGNHTAAAHLLYRALLVRLAGSERLRLHPAKTSGDYARELRSRKSDAAMPFREFSRTYERAVYGSADVDVNMWERLHSLAEPLLA